MIDSQDTNPEFIMTQIQTGASVALAVDAADYQDSAPQSPSSGVSVAGGGGLGDGFLGSTENTQGGSGAPCFLGFTLIALPDGGRRRIERIECGDYVLAFDEAGKLYSARVVATFVHEVAEHLKVIFADGRTSYPTKHHRYWQGGADFIPIGELPPGKTVCTLHGDGFAPTEIVSVETIGRDEITKVYNFEVEKYHSYIANGDAVSNAKAGDQVLQQ